MNRSKRLWSSCLIENGFRYARVNSKVRGRCDAAYTSDNRPSEKKPPFRASEVSVASVIGKETAETSDDVG